MVESALYSRRPAAPPVRLPLVLGCSGKTILHQHRSQRYRPGGRNSTAEQSRPHIYPLPISPSPPAHPNDSAVSRYDGRLARQSSLQEAIGYPSLHHDGRLVGLILGVIAEHMRQYLGIKDAFRRRDEGAEILLAVERVA